MLEGKGCGGLWWYHVWTSPQHFWNYQTLLFQDVDVFYLCQINEFLLSARPKKSFVDCNRLQRVWEIAQSTGTGCVVEVSDAGSFYQFLLFLSAAFFWSLFESFQPVFFDKAVLRDVTSFRETSSAAFLLCLWGDCLTTFAFSDFFDFRHPWRHVLDTFRHLQRTAHLVRLIWDPGSQAQVVANCELRIILRVGRRRQHVCHCHDDRGNARSWLCRAAWVWRQASGCDCFLGGPSCFGVGTFWSFWSYYWPSSVGFTLWRTCLEELQSLSCISLEHPHDLISATKRHFPFAKNSRQSFPLYFSSTCLWHLKRPSSAVGPRCHRFEVIKEGGLTVYEGKDPQSKKKGLEVGLDDQFHKNHWGASHTCRRQEAWEVKNMDPTSLTTRTEAGWIQNLFSFKHFGIPNFELPGVLPKGAILEVSVSRLNWILMCATLPRPWFSNRLNACVCVFFFFWRNHSFFWISSPASHRSIMRL